MQPHEDSGRGQYDGKTLKNDGRTTQRQTGIELFYEQLLCVGYTDSFCAHDRSSLWQRKQEVEQKGNGSGLLVCMLLSNLAKDVRFIANYWTWFSQRSPENQKRYYDWICWFGDSFNKYTIAVLWQHAKRKSRSPKSVRISIPKISS